MMLLPVTAHVAMFFYLVEINDMHRVSVRNFRAFGNIHFISLENMRPFCLDLQRLAVNEVWNYFPYSLLL